MQRESQEACMTWLVAEILECHQKLSQSATLHPSPHINRLFERLMDACCYTIDEHVIDKVLTHPRIHAITTPLRQLCSNGEYHLEAYWTERILNKKSQAEARAELLQFTYHGNYVDLIRTEMSALASVAKGPRPAKFAVLGSGPLPMTLICILHSLDTDGQAATVHGFDRDAWAISKSSELCCRLGCNSRNFGFHCLDVQNDTFDLLGFDVVYLASLVGIKDEEKHNAISRTVKQMRPGALLVIRSAHSLRGLLYPVVNISSDLTSLGLRPLLVVHPYNHVINSVVVCQIDLPTHSTLNGWKHKGEAQQC